MPRRTRPLPWFRMPGSGGWCAWRRHPSQGRCPGGSTLPAPGRAEQNSPPPPSPGLAGPGWPPRPRRTGRRPPCRRSGTPAARGKTHTFRGCACPARRARGGMVIGGRAPRPACGGDAARRSTDGSTSDLHTGHRSAGSKYPYQSSVPFVGPGASGTSCRSPAVGDSASLGGPSAGAPLLGRSHPGMSRPPVESATTSRTGHTTRGHFRGRQAARRSGLRRMVLVIANREMKT